VDVSKGTTTGATAAGATSTSTGPTRTAPHGTSGTDGDGRTIGQLVADISNQMSGLVRAEIALAKTEVKADVAKGGVGAGLLAGAAFLGLVAFLLLCFAGVYGLVEAGLDEWASFLVVTGVLLVLAAILALVGRGRLKQVTAPQRTIETAKGSVEAIKGHSTAH
jgi:uncharacterized membrane protein YqjE